MARLVVESLEGFHLLGQQRNELKLPPVEASLWDKSHCSDHKLGRGFLPVSGFYLLFITHVSG